MSEIRLVIQGEPVAKGRPRLSRNGTYTPEKTKTAEEAIGWAFKQSGQKKLEGMLNLFVSFRFTLPKSASKKLKGMVRMFKATRPDLDNLVKLVTDALNGLAYDDDSQIISINAEKVYAEQAYTEIWITEELE